jgi:hypothetical protein
VAEGLVLSVAKEGVITVADEGVLLVAEEVPYLGLWYGHRKDFLRMSSVKLSRVSSPKLLRMSLLYVRRVS